MARSRIRSRSRQIKRRSRVRRSKSRPRRTRSRGTKRRRTKRRRTKRRRTKRRRSRTKKHSGGARKVWDAFRKKNQPSPEKIQEKLQKEQFERRRAREEEARRLIDPRTGRHYSNWGQYQEVQNLHRPQEWLREHRDRVHDKNEQKKIGSQLEKLKASYDKNQEENIESQLSELKASQFEERVEDLLPD